MTDSSKVNLVRISTVYTRDIPVSIPFFDSLREDYKGFNEWYNRTAAENRQAWIVGTRDSVDALCIFKEEVEGEKINDSGETLPRRFLKLCTLKVAEVGVKYGQRLLYSAFLYCLINDLSAVYVQVRIGRHNELIELLKDYGFKVNGKYNNDLCFVKDMTRGDLFPSSRAPNLVFDYFRTHYPYHLDDINVRKFVVALSQGEHDILFPDARNQMLALPLPNRHMFGETNAIKKIFAKNIGFKWIRKGDILFFYQKDRRGGATIECMGVVENCKKYRNIAEIPSEILDRLPIGREVVNRFLERTKYVMIVSFRLVPTSSQGLSRKELREGIFNSTRSTRYEVLRLADELYREFFKGKIDRFGVSAHMNIDVINGCKSGWVIKYWCVRILARFRMMIADFFRVVQHGLRNG